MQDFTRTVQISPRNPMFFGRAWGTVRGRLGDIQGGLADLQKAADLAVEQNNSAIHKEVINYIQQIRIMQRLGL